MNNKHRKLSIVLRKKEKKTKKKGKGKTTEILTIIN
jgi:hypothetical protein